MAEWKKVFDGSEVSSNEYNQKAYDFLRDTETRCTITYLGKYSNKLWDENVLRNEYRCTFTRKGVNRRFFFWDSISNTTENKIGIEPYDILYCVMKYDCGSFEDFCNEFGYRLYDEDEMDYDKESMRIYKACCEEYDRVCALWDDVLDKLREIE